MPLLKCLNCKQLTTMVRSEGKRPTGKRKYIRCVCQKCYDKLNK